MMRHIVSTLRHNFLTGNANFDQPARLSYLHMGASETHSL